MEIPSRKHVTMKNLSKIKVRKPRKTSWTVNEQIAYIDFLRKNISLMRNKEQRREIKVFKLMGEAIGTRSSIQAKTHHQKMEQKYETTSSIIHHVGLIIKKTLILHAQKNKQIAVENKSQDTIQSIIVQAKAELMEEEANIKKDYLTCSSFFECLSEDYGLIQWQSVVDDREPLI